MYFFTYLRIIFIKYLIHVINFFKLYMKYVVLKYPKVLYILTNDIFFSKFKSEAFLKIFSLFLRNLWMFNNKSKGGKRKFLFCQQFVLIRNINLSRIYSVTEHLSTSVSWYCKIKVNIIYFHHFSNIWKTYSST